MTMAGKKVWRDAATIMLTAKSVSSHSSGPAAHFNYSVLMLKRSSRSKFMPNAFVFPGGVVSSSDFSSKWLELFKNHGHSRDDLEELVLKSVDRPLLMRGSSEEGLVRDISLRLTAIRETFEESGVLLTRSKDERGAFTFSDPQSLSDWRSRVHRDPDQLLQLFHNLDTVPDLWSLREWSDWLTPTDLHEQGSRRFDTLFYQASLDQVPHTALDQAEISAVQWTDPASILQQFYDRQIWLAPPQVYELSKLLNFTDLHQLDRVSEERHGHGLTTWLPVRMQCHDGLLSLLPGDHLYPDNPDYTGPGRSDEDDKSPVKKSIQINYDGSLEDSRGQDQALNRLEFRDMYDCVPRVSYKSSHNFPVPLPFFQYQVLFEGS